MDPEWLRNLLRTGQESMAGTKAEWNNFDRFVTELNGTWTDAAGQVVLSVHLEAIRAQAHTLQANASEHLAVLDAVGGQAADFAAVCRACDQAAAQFRRARTDAVSDLNEAAADAERGLGLAGTAAELAKQAAAGAARLAAQG